jgi:type IV pilus assembly protein PilP
MRGVRALSPWLGALLAACGAEEDPVADLRRMAERKPPAPEPAAGAVAGPLASEDLAFEPLERSPFAGSAAGGEAASSSAVGPGPRPNPDRPREPLEAFPLKALRLVGTMALPDGSRQAFVEAPDGLVYRVGPGAHLGKHRGRVEKVGTDRVVLRELVSDGQGNWEARESTLSMRSE